MNKGLCLPHTLLFFIKLCAIMIRVEFRTKMGVFTVFYLVFMRSEHKGNVRDVKLKIFDLLRKYSSLCVISLKWDNRYKNLYSEVSSCISMEDHLYYISLGVLISICFWRDAKHFLASRTLPRSLTNQPPFLTWVNCYARVCKSYLANASLKQLCCQIKTCCHAWDM